LSIINQILLSGISPEQLIELLRPMVREELRLVIAEQDEKLLSPAKTCEIFIPAITKAACGFVDITHFISSKVYHYHLSSFMRQMHGSVLTP